MALHDARTGYQQNADVYAATRPSYPEAVLRRLADELAIGPGSRVLESGAGTGKLTRDLAGLGALVVATEPVPAMLGRLHAELPQVGACYSAAEAQPFAAGNFDAAIAAQAWHWFDGPAVLTELERTLVPGGRLGMIWNAYDASEPWVAEYHAVRYARADVNTPDHRSGSWRAAFAGRPGWDPLRTKRYRHQQLVRPQDLVDLMLSSSVMGSLDAAGRAIVTREVHAVLAKHPQSRGPERIALPYVTTCWWTRRSSPGQ